MQAIDYNKPLILLFIVLFAAILRVPTLFEPWGSDQGVYGYIATSILEGKVPYRDMYTSTGYGLFFIYALFLKFFGNHMASIHIADFLAMLITVILVYYLTYRLYGKECAIFAGIIVALFGSGSSFSGMYDLKGAWGTYWQLAQRETFMTPLFTAGILISVIAEQKRKWPPYFWVGILIGLAAVLKITAVGMAVLLIVYLVYSDMFRSDGNGIKLCMLKIISAAFGFVIIQFPFLYYFWIHDSLHTMYNAIFIHTSIYATLSRGNIVANAFMGTTYILFENLFLWIFSLVVSIDLMVHERKKENCLIVVWTLGMILIILGQGKFFGYHYILIIAPFSVLTGLGIVRYLKNMASWRESFLSARKDMLQIFLWILIFGNLFAFFANNYDDYRKHALYLSGHISKDLYYEVFNEYPLHLYSFRADYDVVNYLKNHAKRGASLRTVNGGGDTIIHCLSGIRSPTRFTSTWYLFNPNLYQDALTAKLRREFIKGITSEQPDYILLIYFSMDEFRQEYKDVKYKDVIMLMDYIKDNYVLEKSFRDRRTLYKRI